MASARRGRAFSALLLDYRVVLNNGSLFYEDACTGDLTFIGGEQVC